MRSAAYEAPEQLELHDVDEPRPEAGQALVEVAMCGICGSDLHTYSHGSYARPGQVLGHEFSGRIVAAPGVDGLAPGDRVVVRPLVPCGECEGCRAGTPQLCESRAATIIGFGAPGAFAERVLVPKAIAGETIFPLPDHVDDRAGALVEPLAVALHAVRLAAPPPGATALVLGAGTIGLGVVRFLRLGGAGTIIVSDPSALRREAAVALGADVTFDPLERDGVEAVREVTGPGEYGRGGRVDVVVDCSGAPGVLKTALDSARVGGTVVLAAMGSAKAEIRPDSIAVKELTVRGSMAYSDEFPAVLAALADGSIDATALVSHIFPLDRIREAFRTQLDRDASLKVMVTPNANEASA